MKRIVMMAILASFVSGCGEDEGDSGGVNVNGNGNFVSVVQDSEFDDCSGVVFRFAKRAADGTVESAIDCADTEDEIVNCEPCFSSSFVSDNGYESETECISDLVDKGICSDQALAVETETDDSFDDVEFF